MIELKKKVEAEPRKIHFIKSEDIFGVLANIVVLWQRTLKNGDLLV